MRTMSRITRKCKVVCLHVISVPYHTDGVNLQHIVHAAQLGPFSIVHVAQLGPPYTCVCPHPMHLHFPLGLWTPLCSQTSPLNPCIHTPCIFAFHLDHGRPFAIRQLPQTHTSTPHVLSRTADPPLPSDFPLELACCGLPIHHKLRPCIRRGPLLLEVAAQVHRAAQSSVAVTQLTASRLT